MSAFGDLILPGDIEDAILTVLRTWSNTYLRQMERLVNGLDAGSLPAIKSWSAASSSDGRFPEQQFPGIQVLWTDEVFEGHADSLSATVDITVEVGVRSTSFREARRLAGIYAFAHNLIVTQQLDEHELITSVTTPRISVPDIAGAARRWAAVGTIDFTVSVDQVINQLAGPEQPAPDPTPVPPEYPTVEEGGAHISVDLTPPPEPDVP